MPWLISRSNLGAAGTVPMSAPHQEQTTYMKNPTAVAGSRREIEGWASRLRMVGSGRYEAAEAAGLKTAQPPWGKVKSFMLIKSLPPAPKAKPTTNTWRSPAAGDRAAAGPARAEVGRGKSCGHLLRLWQEVGDWLAQIFLDQAPQILASIQVQFVRPFVNFRQQTRG